MTKPLPQDLKHKLTPKFELIVCPTCRGFGSLRIATDIFGKDIQELTCRTCNEYGQVIRIK